MKKSWAFRPLLGLVLVASIACSSKPPALHPAAVPPVVAAPSAQGAVSADLLFDPSGGKVVLGPDEEFKHQYTSASPVPSYPVDLIGLRLPPQVVAVRILIGECSEIVSITESPLAKESADPRYRAAFEESVRDAVQYWKYWPAQIRKSKPGPDLDGDGKPDYRIVTDIVTLKTAFDIAFTFRIVDGKPVVDFK